MLSIRLQRVGRKGHAVYRVIVQDSHRHPTSGNIVAQVGTYDPHTKLINLKKEKVQTYLDNGAQPTPRVVTLLQAEKIKLPKWVKLADTKKQKTIKNKEKLRRNQPAEEKPAEEPVAEAPVETPTEEAPVVEEKPAEEAAPKEKAEEPAKEEKTEEEKAPEAPAEEKPSEEVPEAPVEG
jgi:small subunit ribosomal protein S16